MTRKDTSIHGRKSDWRAIGDAVYGEEFGVWCCVSGGFTGTREAWLKAEGEVRRFATEREAQDEAARLNKEMNHAHSTANFRYAARPYEWP